MLVRQTQNTTKQGNKAPRALKVSAGRSVEISIPCMRR